MPVDALHPSLETPIEELLRQAGNIIELPLDDLTPKMRGAVSTLLNELTRLRAELGQNQSRLTELERLVDEDLMLPMLNRRAFLRELTRAIVLCRRYKIECCLAYVDVDGLKQINGTAGNAAGDAVLRHVAGHLMSQVRASDVVGRLGGDEFGILLMHLDRDAALTKSSEIAANFVARPGEWDGRPLPVAISYGVYPLSDGDAADEMLARAEQEMYQSRRLRRAMIT